MLTYLLYYVDSRHTINILSYYSVKQMFCTGLDLLASVEINCSFIPLSTCDISTSQLNVLEGILIIITLLYVGIKVPGRKFFIRCGPYQEVYLRSE